MNIRAFQTARCERAESQCKTMINQFEMNRHSEEIFPVTEQEHDEVMAMMADEDFAGYGEWSAALESENFTVRNGRIEHKPEPKSQGRLKGFEL